MLAAPHRDLDRRSVEIGELAARAARCLTNRLDRAGDELVHVLARVRALSPSATLERGYAIVQDDAGRVVTSAAETGAGEHLRIRLAKGRIAADVTQIVAADE